MEFLTQYKYIEEENAKKIPQYKYSGVDHSLIQRFILHPLAEFQIKYFFIITNSIK